MLLFLLLLLVLAIGVYYQSRQSWQLQAKGRLNLAPPRLRAKLQQLENWPNWWTDTSQQGTLFFFRGESRGAGASMQWKQQGQQHLVISQVQSHSLRYLHRFDNGLQLEGQLYWERCAQGSLLCWKIKPLPQSPKNWPYWRCYFRLKRQLPQRLQQLTDYYNEA